MSYHPLVLKHFLLDNNAGEKSVRSTHFGVCIQINSVSVHHAHNMTDSGAHQ